MDRTNHSTKMLILILTFLYCLSLASCANLPKQDENLIYTLMAETLSANLTETEAARPTDTPTPIPTETPTSTPTEVPPTLVPTSSEPTATSTIGADFADKAEFVSVLPSPNQFTPGQTFYLTWQIKNTGKSNWSGKYSFFHADGIQLAGQSSYAIDSVIEPGGTLTVSMLATAPESEGNYQTTWSLSNPDGIVFYSVYYNLVVGETTYITDVVDDATATPSSLSWMCTDADRSNIQGSGCADYCTDAVILSLATQNRKCYSNGTALTVSE